jgi:glycosyltransferase involved in cell wall biosynthesis
MVLTQALASGLPVVCTNRTGGPDLAHTSALAARITVVPSGSVGALVEALEIWRDRIQAERMPAPLTNNDRESLSWAAYARRHAAEITRDLCSIDRNL